MTFHPNTSILKSLRLQAKPVRLQAQRFLISFYWRRNVFQRRKKKAKTYAFFIFHHRCIWRERFDQLLIAFIAIKTFSASFNSLIVAISEIQKIFGLKCSERGYKDTRITPDDDSDRDGEKNDKLNFTNKYLTMLSRSRLLVQVKYKRTDFKSLSIIRYSASIELNNSFEMSRELCAEKFFSPRLRQQLFFVEINLAMHK